MGEEDGVDRQEDPSSDPIPVCPKSGCSPAFAAGASA